MNSFFVSFVDGSSNTINCDEWEVLSDGFVYFQDYDRKRDVITKVAFFKKELIASVISKAERIS